MVKIWMEVGRHKFLVEGFEDASQEFCAYRDRLGLGASQMPDGIISEIGTGKVIARVGYNGRVWKPEPWTPESVPLYDNQPPEPPPAPKPDPIPVRPGCDPAEGMMQEVWITIRLKGEMNAAYDADAIAKRVLLECEKLFVGQDRGTGFETAADGDVIEVEEEAEIYHPEGM